MKYVCIKLEFAGNIAILTLNKPEALNAVSFEMLRELADGMEQIESRADEIRCLLFTGAGRGFCSGADITGFTDYMTAGNERDIGEPLETWYNPLFLRLRDLGMPIITAVNGPAAGVGMSLALMGDLVLAARSCYFLQAFSRVGLIPDGGATYLLPRLVGRARAMELSMLAEKLPAETALQWGLINRVYDDEQLMPEALKMAKRLSEGPTATYRLLRKAYWRSLENTYGEQLDLERILQKDAGRTEDFIEGSLAFLERRPARFKGR
ncbi:MAG: enoyl-CoA hydratase/isomerase [Deltaproteobacteria bacterium]|nr:enoyl-CoA hydratase/isomerase [Deltaproteobacteria bacterium]